ncbi:MAG: hypothetical protein ACE5OZ_19900 [Candidatus Heimdallarchaeota archaeon]
MAEKEILKELLVDKQAMLREAVAKAKDLIGIDEHSGDVVFKISLATLSVQQKIELYLIARYFAKGLKLIKSDKTSIDELSKNLGIEKKNVGWRSSEMEDDGIIHSAGRSKYVISPVKVSDILDDIRKKLGI